KFKSNMVCENKGKVQTKTKKDVDKRRAKKCMQKNSNVVFVTRI
ncbi:hypothetical protein AC249_AIPGENE25780, partial [Exaiptasia diaphana]